MLPWLASARAVGGPAKVCVAVPLLIFIVLMRAHLEGSTLRLHVEGSTLGITAQAMPDTLALQRPAPRNEPGNPAGAGAWTAGWFTQAGRWMGSAAGWWFAEPAPRMGAPAPTDDAWSAVFNNNNNNAAAAAASNGRGYGGSSPYSIYKSPTAKSRSARPRPSSDSMGSRNKDRDRDGGGGGGG